MKNTCSNFSIHLKLYYFNCDLKIGSDFDSFIRVGSRFHNRGPDYRKVLILIPVLANGTKYPVLFLVP